MAGHYARGVEFVEFYSHSSRVLVKRGDYMAESLSVCNRATRGVM